ncbi:MAG: PaaI family thioesterase [Pseudomonadota bacterium]
MDEIKAADLAGFNAPEGFKPAGFGIEFLDQAGPYFIKSEKDCHIVGMRIAASHVNSWHVAHGGVMATLADVALSLQVFRSTRPPQPLSTISLSTNFISGAKLDDWLEAHCRIDRIGKSIAYVSGHILNGDMTAMTMTAAFKLLKTA